MGILGGGILSRLRGLGKQDDGSPMSSLRAATRWAENLPLGDVLKSQQAIAAELKRYNEGERVCTPEQLAALMLLDEKSRDLQDTLTRQYLRNPRMPREAESQLWHSIYALEWELVQGYRAFVLNFSRSSGKCAYEVQVPRAALRCILHYGTLLKWRALRYLEPSERLWNRLHALYAASEAEGFHLKPVIAYPDDKSPRTVETAYGNILMLDLVNSGTFYPRQIDLIERWLAHWNTSYAFRTDPGSPQGGFVVDLSSDTGPKRARNPAADKPLRYWSSEPLLRVVRNAQEAIRQGAAPSSLGLTEDVRTGECQGLLEHLLHQWAVESSREQRRAPRIEVKRMVDLVHSLPVILSQIDGTANTGAGDNRVNSAYEEAQDIQVYGFVTTRTRERLRDQPAAHGVERWVMQNESACGYGAMIEAHSHDWLRVGVLVGVRPREDAAWRVGVVRRLSRVSGESVSVGIEIVGDSADIAHLIDGNLTGYTIAGDGYQGAEKQHEILVVQRTGGTISLILDPICFQPDHVWLMQSAGGAQRVRLTHPLQHGEGWMEVAYEAV